MHATVCEWGGWLVLKRGTMPSAIPLREAVSYTLFVPACGADFTSNTNRTIEMSLRLG